MEIHNWKIFDKKGSYVNWYRDSYVNIQFVTDAQNALGAEAYALTDSSAVINEVIVTNSGWNYDPNNTIPVLQYTFAENQAGYALSPAEASVNFIDVSVFSPEPANVKGIGSMTIDLSAGFIYPAVSFSGAFFMDPVAVGLVETEHLTIFQETSTGKLIRPYDPSTQLIFRCIENDTEIKLFTVNEEEQIIEWADELIYDTDVESDFPIVLNVGFRSEDDGVFERRLRVYERRISDGFESILAEFVVNAQSIPQEERFDTLLQDLAPILNAKEIPHLFKEANINEALPDWELINYKSKHAILDYSNITPYIGTYKALINTIKWLGYEDIKVKEWFRDVKEGNKLGLYVPYEAEERTKTILYFSPEERKNLKKLNELSLVYCINRETGEIDEYGNPETENCYEYNLDEVLTKLFALKNWLEVNIIGVNARVVDLTGEGIYFERFRNILYGTQDQGSRAEYVQSITPITLDDDSELIRGDSSIALSLREYSQTEIQDFENFRIRDFIDYGYTQDPSFYDPCTGTYNTIPNDASILNDFDASLIRVGASFRNPFWNLLDLQWRASVENTESGVLTDKFATNPLWVYDNDLRYYNIYDDESRFYDISTNLDLVLEQAFFRDASNDIWTESIAYSIYKDPSTSLYVMESSTGDLTYFPEYAIFSPSSGNPPELQYNVDDNYMAPLLSFKNYKFTDIDGNSQILDQNKLYYLDILDGKIAMDSSTLDPAGKLVDTTHFINFNYDTSIDEQKITLNVVYNSQRFPLYQYDPSIYYDLTINNYQDPSASLIIDNSVYNMHVNHIGHYSIEVFGWDGQNVAYNNIYRNELGVPTYPVWTKYPTILSYIDSSSNSGFEYDASWNVLADTSLFNLYNTDNQKPIFDRTVPLQGLTLEYDGENKPYINVPSITFFQDVPDPGTFGKFYNLTERCVSINNPTEIIIDPDFQSFTTDDSINVVLFNKGDYDIIDQSTNVVAGISGNIVTLADPLPSGFALDNSTQIYIQNDSLRSTSNIVNDIINETVEVDVSNYTFGINQLVGLIIDDVCTGYTWGSSFRVIDVSGVTHTMEGNIPSFVVDNSARYTVEAKHGFSTYSEFQIEIESATEENQNFEIYLNDIYYHQYYLDNTFIFMNVLFDQKKVIEQWYDPSDGLLNGYFYPYDTAINIDPSTLVILRAEYDPSNYMLDQKNIWTVKEHESGDILMRVFNDTVFYVFDVFGNYDVTAEAYDSFGNLREQVFEGLIRVE